jgi:hypothetical protein
MLPRFQRCIGNHRLQLVGLEQHCRLTTEILPGWKKASGIVETLEIKESNTFIFRNHVTTRQSVGFHRREERFKRTLHFISSQMNEFTADINQIRCNWTIRLRRWFVRQRAFAKAFLAAFHWVMLYLNVLARHWFVGAQSNIFNCHANKIF